MKSFPSLFSLRLAASGLLFVMGVCPALAQSTPATYALPASGDYGGSGSFTVSTVTFANPVYAKDSSGTYALNVSVLYPGASIDVTKPTIFFAHGLTTHVGATSDYSALLNNLASQGYNVIFSPYEGTATPTAPVTLRFDELVTGWNAAVANYGLNTARVGFVGHSFGGGFLPAVIQHEMRNLASAYRAGHAWGGTAAFMFSMSPAYAYDGGGSTVVSSTQAITFPSNLNVVMQAYNDDQTVVDARLAIDIFYNVSTLNAQKDFQTIYGDSHGTPAQVASHYLPATNVAQTSTALQAWGVFRPMDALAAYTFDNTNTAAQAIAFGHGVEAETYNGVWSDGVPVVAKGVTDLPSGNYYYYSTALSAQYYATGATGNPRLAIPLAGPPQYASTGFASGNVTFQASGLLVGRGYVEQSSANLSSWATASSFTAAQTTQSFTHAAAAGSAPQFWRILAQ